MKKETPKEVVEDIIDLETNTPSVAADPIDADTEVGDVTTAAPEAQPAPPTVYKGPGVRWGLFGVLILAVLIVVLALQNPENVEFVFLTFSITAPLSAIILGTAVVAVALDELAGWIWGIRKRRRLRTKAELKQLKSKQEPEKTRRFGKK